MSHIPVLSARPLSTMSLSMCLRSGHITISLAMTGDNPHHSVAQEIGDHSQPTNRQRVPRLHDHRREMKEGSVALATSAPPRKRFSSTTHGEPRTDRE